MIQVDGADNVQTYTGLPRATPSQEAAREFRVLNSTYLAEYGRALGGFVNILTKSGTKRNFSFESSRRKAACSIRRTVGLGKVVNQSDNILVRKPSTLIFHFCDDGLPLFLCKPRGVHSF